MTLKQIDTNAFVQFKESCLHLLTEGILLENSDRIYLAQEAWSISDSIIAQLFVIDEAD